MLSIQLNFFLFFLSEGVVLGFLNVVWALKLQKYWDSTQKENKNAEYFIFGETWFPKFKIWASTPDAHHGLIFDARVIKDHQHIYLSGVKKQAKNIPCPVSFGFIL